MTTPYFIEELPDIGLVTLFVEIPADLFLDVFSSRPGLFLITNMHFGLTQEHLVGAMVTASLDGWANLCRTYPNDEFIRMIEHHFYENHFTQWVHQGMV